jgi:hypothetical protein
VNASIAFYRKLGMEITDAVVWRTPSGAHHVNAAAPPTDQAIHFSLHCQDRE